MLYRSLIFSKITEEKTWIKNIFEGDNDVHFWWAILLQIIQARERTHYILGKKEYSFLAQPGIYTLSYNLKTNTSIIVILVNNVDLDY